MSRVQLLRYLEDMHHDANVECGVLPPDECAEMRAQHDLTYLVLLRLVKDCSRERIDTLLEGLKPENLKGPT